MFTLQGKNAFFKPLHSSPMLPSRIVDEAILEERGQVRPMHVYAHSLAYSDSRSLVRLAVT